MRAQNSRKYLAVGIAATLCWGGATTLTKLALRELEPGMLLIVQLLSSIVFLGLMLSALRIRLPPLRRSLAVAALGLLEPGLAYFLALEGLSRISATEAVVLSSSEAFMIVILSWLIAREPLRASVLGISLCGALGALLISGEHLGLSGTGVSLAGDALLLGGVFSAAVYVVLSARWALDAAAPAVLLYQQLCALALAVALQLLLRGRLALPAHVSAAGWLLAVGSGVVQYAWAFWLYLYALKGLPTNVAGVLLSLVPVFGIAVSVPILGDRMSPLQWGGAFVVVASVSLLSWVRHARAEEPRAMPAEV